MSNEPFSSHWSWLTHRGVDGPHAGPSYTRFSCSRSQPRRRARTARTRSQPGPPLAAFENGWWNCRTCTWVVAVPTAASPWTCPGRWSCPRSASCWVRSRSRSQGRHLRSCRGHSSDSPCWKVQGIYTVKNSIVSRLAKKDLSENTNVFRYLVISIQYSETSVWNCCTVSSSYKCVSDTSLIKPAFN